MHLLDFFKLQLFLILLLARQTSVKFRRSASGGAQMQRSFGTRFLFGFIFMRRMWKNNAWLVENCVKKARILKQTNSKVAVVGCPQVFEIFKMAASLASLRIEAFKKPEEWSQLKNFGGYVVVAEFRNVSSQRRKLEALGLPNQRIMSLL